MELESLNSGIVTMCTLQAPKWTARQEQEHTLNSEPEAKSVQTWLLPTGLEPDGVQKRLCCPSLA